MSFAGTIIETAKNQLEQTSPFVWLAEIPRPGPTAKRFRLTSNNEPVEWDTTSQGDPITWDPFPIAFEGLQQNTRGDLEGLSLSVADESYVIAKAANEAKLAGLEVILRFVSLLDLSDPNAVGVYANRISALTLVPGGAKLDLGSVDLTKRMVPRRRYSRNRCGVRFGSPECGYDLAAPGAHQGPCSRLFPACEFFGEDELLRALPQKHPERFDAFLGLETSPRAL